MSTLHEDIYYLGIEPERGSPVYRQRLGQVLHRIKTGDGVSDEDGFGRQPLHYAARTGEPDIIQALLEAGNDVNGKDLRGYSPLCMAVCNHQEQAVIVLLEAGAEVNQTDHDNKSPLSHAAWQGNWGMVKLLLDRGAELETDGQNGNSPLNCVNWRGETEPELSIAEAADFLSVSEERVTALLEQGELNGGAEQGKRRVRIKDLMVCKTRLRQDSLMAMEELTRTAQQNKMGY